MTVSTDVVMKFITLLFQGGYNVTCDNFFTSLDLALRLAVKNGSFEGTMRQNRREVTEECKKKTELHETKVFRHDGQTAITLT